MDLVEEIRAYLDEHRPNIGATRAGLLQRASDEIERLRAGEVTLDIGGLPRRAINVEYIRDDGSEP